MIVTAPEPFASGSVTTMRHRIESQMMQMERVQQQHIPHWKDCARMVLPRRPRWFTQDANKGDRRNHDIIDSSGTMANRTLSSGMMAGVTSPARPWFRLTTPDPADAERADMKAWLHTTTSRMSTVFVRSNLYHALPVCYADLGTFGTAAIFLEEDDEDIIRVTPLPIGSYYIANDAKGRVRVFGRKFTMTVRQVVEKWCRVNGDPSLLDTTNLSLTTRALLADGNLEAPVEISHCIYPNPKYSPKRMTGKHKMFAEVYYEAGRGPKDTQGFLAEGGYDEFPVLVPRWEVVGEDVWATNCPAMTALGDVKQLQMGERRSLQVLDKKVNPPLQAPMSLKTARPSIIAGEITYHDDRGEGMRPIHEINLTLEDLEFKQGQVRQRISRAWFEDLFLMLASSDRRQITAREIDERHEEKLLALGPVLEQLNQDLLNPLIDRTFAIMVRRGMIPPAPKGLEGSLLKVEYISIMAQAQRMVGIGGLERFTGYITALSQFVPDILDKVDFDQVADEFGEMTGVPPRVVVPDEDVQEIRMARMQQKQAQQQAELQAMQAKTARDFSSAAGPAGGDPTAAPMGAAPADLLGLSTPAGQLPAMQGI